VTGTNHQTVVPGRSPRHRGVLMGRVTQVRADSVIIKPDPAARPAPLKAGDGLVFDAADWRSPEAPEEGGRVFQVIPLSNGSAGRLELRFGNGAVNFGRIRPGDLVWRSHDPDLDKAARPYTQASTPVHKQPLHVHVIAREGEPLSLTWTLIEQPAFQVTVLADEPLPTAQNRTISPDYLHEQLGRLGNTPYELAELELMIDGQPFAPSSLLNQLRRQAVDALIERQSRSAPITLHDPAAVLAAAIRQTIPPAPISTAAHWPDPQWHLLVRTPDQLEAALDLKPASITLDYLDLYGLKPAVERIRESGITVRVASPRILKPDEQRMVNFLRRLDCQLLIRSSGLLQALQAEAHPPLIGDFSLNAANRLTAETFFKMGLLRLTPTHDLNAAQIAALAAEVGPARLETVVYHHLPVFHTEHCVFCRFLSKGTSYQDCGQPCETHRVALRDVAGRAHPVMADVGCRNTVFGAEAQIAAPHLADWWQAGLYHFRLEFVHETPQQVTDITRAFVDALANGLSAAELTQRLIRIAPQGTTEGSLFVPDDYLALPML
jgi:putative protease